MVELPVIETARTVLRILQPDQAHLIAGYYAQNKHHLAAWESLRDASFYSEQAWQQRVADSSRAFQNGTGINFAAIDPASGKMIASCNFSNIVRGVFHACHMGYSVAAEVEGQGLMQEVAQAGIGYMFEDVGLREYRLARRYRYAGVQHAARNPCSTIMANHMPSNIRSERLLCKLGFEREGYAKAYLKIAGKWEDHVLNALINRNGEQA